MDPFQPFLIALLALLALLVAVAVALVVQTRRWRRQRHREQAVIAAATPRMNARLAAIGDPSIPPEPDPPYIPYVVLAALARSASIAQAASSRRRVWRDASAALVVLASIGLVVVLAMPAVGQPAPEPIVPSSEVGMAETAAPTIAPTQAAMAIIRAPLPTRVEVLLPTEAPTPTLPVTQTPKPTERVTTAARATPRPTARPKPTPRPTPRPTPVPQPVARFAWSVSGMTVVFDNNSKTYGAAAKYAWTFGDGATTGAVNPSHTYADSGCYFVSLTVRTKGGSDTSTRGVGVGLACP